MINSHSLTHDNNDNKLTYFSIFSNFVVITFYSNSECSALACWMHCSLTQVVVDLKRFSQDYAFRSKLSTEVKCPTKNLDLRKFSSEKGKCDV